MGQVAFYNKNSEFWVLSSPPSVCVFLWAICKKKKKSINLKQE